MVATARAGGDSRGGRRARGRRSLVGVGRRLGIRSVSEIRRRGARDRRGGARPNLVTRGGSGDWGWRGSGERPRVANERGRGGWRTTESGERTRAARERGRGERPRGANDAPISVETKEKGERKTEDEERSTRRHDAPPRRASPTRLPAASPSPSRRPPVEYIPVSKIISIARRLLRVPRPRRVSSPTSPTRRNSAPA